MSSPYQQFLTERDEILRHKWIESEKAGRDIGFEAALFDWAKNYRATWKEKILASVNDKDPLPQTHQALDATQ